MSIFREKNNPNDSDGRCLFVFDSDGPGPETRYVMEFSSAPLNQSSIHFKIEEQKILLVKGYSSNSLRKPHAAILTCL